MYLKADLKVQPVCPCCKQILRHECEIYGHLEDDGESYYIEAKLFKDEYIVQCSSCLSLFRVKAAIIMQCTLVEKETITTHKYKNVGETISSLDVIED